MPKKSAEADANRNQQSEENAEEKPAFRAPGDAATLPELIRFLIDRTGYIKALEAEGSPEAFSRRLEQRRQVFLQNPHRHRLRGLRMGLVAIGRLTAPARYDFSDSQSSNGVLGQMTNFNNANSYQWLLASTTARCPATW